VASRNATNNCSIAVTAASRVDSNITRWKALSVDRFFLRQSHCWSFAEVFVTNPRRGGDQTFSVPVRNSESCRGRSRDQVTPCASRAARPSAKATARRLLRVLARNLCNLAAAPRALPTVVVFANRPWLPPGESRV